jgi:hypothetical protein
VKAGEIFTGGNGGSRENGLAIADTIHAPQCLRELIADCDEFGAIGGSSVGCVELVTDCDQFKAANSAAVSLKAKSGGKRLRLKASLNRKVGTP